MGEGLCPGGVSVRETPWTETSPPPVNRMTDASKNITLPQTSFAGGNKDKEICYKKSCNMTIGTGEAGSWRAPKIVHQYRRGKWNQGFFIELNCLTDLQNCCNRKYCLQKCIPVGCVPSVAVAVTDGGGGCLSKGGEYLLMSARHPPGQNDRHV